MRELIATPLQPLNTHDLDDIESALPLALPAQLRQLLAFSDGGHLRNNLVLRVPDGSTSAAISVLRAQEIGEVTLRTLGSRPRKLAWARDGNGNLLTIDSSSKVYFWDHDTDEHIPLKCQLDSIGSLFFERAPAPTKKAATTADPLKALMEANASASDIQELLQTSLSQAPEVAQSFILAAAQANRSDVIRQIAPTASPSQATLNRALAIAARRSSIAAMEELLALGAEIDSRHPGNDMTPLMEAALAGQDRSVRFLLGRGADPSLKTKQGLAAAQMAGISGYGELKQILLSVQREDA